MQRPYTQCTHAHKMNIIKETFDKSEKLCSRKSMDMLFETGNIFHNSLFKVVWDKVQNPIQSPAQVAFSVSKRGFRLAVTRNLIKRRMREAYRRNKSVLYSHLLSQNLQIVFIVIIKGNSVPDYLTIEKSVRDLINKLIVLTAGTE
jgi:ribonuclease P protein component